jgi:hypothetical protein
MSFLINTLKLIGSKKKRLKDLAEKSYPILQQSDADFDFSLRNYAKESFSILIRRPFSGCALKIIRITSLLIMGSIVGAAAGLICLAVFLQFGSVENNMLSFFIQSRLEKFLPDSDLSMKSAALYWNPRAGSVEIMMRKVRLDDLSIPSISILPDYKKSLEQQRLAVKSITIMNPKISLDASDDLKSFSINPDFERGGSSKELFEPLSTFSNLGCLFDDNVVIKLINANVSIVENGAHWKFKNVYYEHKIGEKFPRAIDCSASFPDQKYVSNICLTRSAIGNDLTYDVKLESLNPYALTSAFARRNIPIDGRIFSIIDGYNLPISGSLKLRFNDAEFLGGDFDLIGSAGSIKLPVKNTLSLNLGKKIDNGSVSGAFSKDGARIDSINVFYGNSGLQLTGINMPLSEFKFLDVANLNGTLSLTNINVDEMEALLPETISRSAIATFKNYLPGFKLELFKVDLKGAVAFGDRASGEQLDVSHGVFKIKDAKIPLGRHVVTNVEASGTVSDDGLDIKLSNAVFEKIRVNRGVFFISNRDNSWIGKINADVPVGDIPLYARDISPRLASLPLEKMHIDGRANFDMKLVQVEGDRANRELPFRIVEGEGVIQSDNNTRELRFSWNGEKLLASGDIVTGKNKVSMKLNENLASASGSGEFFFTSNSDFLDSLIPGFSKICDGDYSLKINSSWKDKFEEYDVDLNLKNAAMRIPMAGDVKFKKDEGRFVAHVLSNGKTFEFSKMFLDTKNSKISGRMTLDRRGRLLKCSIDEFEVGGNSAKINVMKDGDNILCSAVGDCLDLGKAIPIFNGVDRDTTISAYINLKEATFSNSEKIKNVKGSLDLRNGKIIGGACYAVIGEDTTVALAAKDVEGTNEVLLSLSASNAGDFLNYLKIANTISGGNVNFVMKTQKDSDKSTSGAFEISGFIVKNNSQLMKLISLSSNSWLPSSDNLAVGFNFCSANFTIADNQIIVENGRAVGPTMAISYNGSYDRANDKFDLKGISLPMSAILNNPNLGGTLAANYQMSGSLGMPTLSVKPLQFVESAVLNETFGNMLPILSSPLGDINYGVVPPKNATDPFEQRAFDNRSFENRAEETEPAKKTAPRRSSTDGKFGIRIVRGVKNAD